MAYICILDVYKVYSIRQLDVVQVGPVVQVFTIYMYTEQLKSLVQKQPK